MPIVSPARYQPKQVVRKRKPYIRVFIILVVVVGLINYIRPLPQPVATVSVSVPSGKSQPALSWPGSGQAAVAATGYGLLEISGSQTPIATASIAKVITALCVLQKAPLTLGQSGPTYTISAHDVATYQSYVDVYGSVLPVEQGQTFTEYQALQALMVPSANNVADSLAEWVFGSQNAYADYATRFLQQHGLNQTHIGSDASGFDPSTTSTASDLAQLGLLALQNPVLMAIAGQHTASFPIVGTVANYDTILGQNGITGLKTGNNDQDPGAFLFTARSQIGGKSVLLSGAVMGLTDLDSALQATVQLNASLPRGFELVNVVSKDQTVGSFKTSWGASSPIVTNSTIELIRWKASPVLLDHTLDTHTRTGKVGTLKAEASPITAHTDLELQHAVAGPSFWWRLTRH